MNTHFVSHLECSATARHHAADRVQGLSKAGKPLLVRYDLDAVGRAVDRDSLAGRQPGFWRYRELLPVARDEHIVSFNEPPTPLIRVDSLGGGGPLIIKDEGVLPTGSFKARGMSVAVSMAKSFGIKRIVIPTAGNAGSALAAYATRAGIESAVYTPADAPPISVLETRAFGATVVRVDGLVDACGRQAQERIRNGWFDFTTLKEPYRIEGKKTMGLELAEQMGWTLPDAIFYPTGGGTGFIGMWKAFEELGALGWIGPKRPKMIAVQAAGCAPMVHAFDNGLEEAVPWVDVDTIVHGVRVPKPIGDFIILDIMRRSGGFGVAVSDAATLEAQADAARAEGILMCPEGAATLAAHQQALADGRLDPGESVVLFNSASGHKYPLPGAPNA